MTAPPGRSLTGEAFALWLPLAVALTGVFAFVYLAVQQNYRQSLNDPQIQIAEDAALSLSKGSVPADLVQRSVPLIDIAQSLTPWIAVYDSSGKPLESNGELDGAPPQLPAGVFDTGGWNAFIIGHHLNSAPANENRFTWQPRSDVQQAVVLVHAPSSDFAAAGRNMREVEKREGALAHAAAFLWGGTEVASFIAFFVLIALGWL